MTSKIQLQVQVDGEDFSLTSTAGDLARLEREYGISSSTLTQETTSVEHVMFLAWTGLRRLKLGPQMTFDEFLDRADTTGGSETADPPRPLPKPNG